MHPSESPRISDGGRYPKGAISDHGAHHYDGAVRPLSKSFRFLKRVLSGRDNRTVAGTTLQISLEQASNNLGSCSALFDVRSHCDA
jgi:hypothetical protein